MSLKAKLEHKIELSDSYMIGDTLNDIKTDRIVNCKIILVLTG